MRLSVALSSMLLGAVASAQDVQSKPFNLAIKSDNQTLNGQSFAACHSGAAIESLCLSGNQGGSEFVFNTTNGSTSPLDGYEPSSTLVWNLPIANGPSVSEPMSFFTDAATNVALPLFQPGYERQQVTVDKEGILGVFSTLDDTTTPPTSQKSKVLNNWYVCQSYYTGYTYTTLNWVLGNADAKPQNPSCVKVDVQRKFV